MDKYDDRHYKTAANFWETRIKYPDYPNTLKRRLLDVNFISNRIHSMNSVLDLGCGDGSTLLSLREFTEIKVFYGYDISPNLIKQLKNKWGKWSGLNTYTGDFLHLKDFPKVDITLSLGSFPYVFDDADLFKLLETINTEWLIVRAPCNINEEHISEVINKYSEDLGDNYAAIYRTRSTYIHILSKKFDVFETTRAYPDEIESKYGTKHFFFVCKYRR